MSEIGPMEDMTEKELNTIYRTEFQLSAWGESPKPHHVIISDEDWLNTDHIFHHQLAEHFREQSIEAGYKLTALYPVYHHGWECDLWAADAEKDGKEWHLTTNHGGLVAEEIPEFSFMGLIKDMLGYK